jgi:cobalt-zinc-cadmium efflux system outer membrane protein
MSLLESRVAVPLLCLFLLAGRVAFAQDPTGPPAPEDPLLASLIGEALARNPDLLAVKEALTAARARPDQASALPNPMLSLAYTNDGWAPSLGERDMTALAFLWSQDLPYPGKRRLRGDIASLEADSVAQELERARLSLTAAVKRSYYGLILARDLLALVREQEDTWKEIEQVALARYTVGQGAQQDVLRVQVEVTRVDQARTERRTEVEIRLAQLNRLCDRAWDAPLETTAHLALHPLEAGPESALARLTEISPELKSAGLLVDRDRLALNLAHKASKPDFTVQAGYMNRGGLPPMWQASAGVSLPLYGKKQAGARAEAESLLRASERRLESVKLLLRLRTQERLAQIRSAEKIAGLYGNGIIPQDQMSVEAAVANYQVGRVPFIAVLEALSTLYGDRTTHFRLLAGYESVRASLEEGSLGERSDAGSMGAPATATMAASAAGTGPSAAASMTAR